VSPCSVPAGFAKLEQTAWRALHIRDRFIHTGDSIHIYREDDPIFRQQVTELIDLFNDTLGPNDYALRIANAFNEGISNYLGSPSQHSVQEVLGIVRAALTRFERDPELIKRQADAVPVLSLSTSRRVSQAAIDSRKVFIVHGHGRREHEVQAYLYKLKFDPIILHEQPNQGKTVIEKFETHSDVGFAVVLLTPDDVGCFASKAPDELKLRARQNVILELGYFIGCLGRDRVCAFREGDLEMPSDIIGVVAEPLDAGGAWKMRLRDELRAAGYQVLD
jgi:predicted nucleotide-binding protein